VSKEEVVLLVSRTIAIIQCITAMIEITYLPERVKSLNHHSAGRSWLVPDYFTSLYSLGVSVLCFRIAGLLVLTWIFWKCGPWLRRLLLPDQKNEALAESEVIEE